MPYLLFRDWREGTNKLLKNQPAYTRYRETKEYLEWCAQRIQDHPEWFTEYTRKRGIIHVQEEYIAWRREQGRPLDLITPVQQLEKAERVVNRLEGKAGFKEGGGEGSIDRLVILMCGMVGTGKTTTSLALKELLEGQVKVRHVMSDAIRARRTGPIFIRQIVQALEEGVEVVLADRNNHSSKHREEVVQAIRKWEEGQLHGGSTVHILAVSYVPVHGDPTFLEDLQLERINARGENHQSLTPLRVPGGIKSVVKRFQRQWEPVIGLDEGLDGVVWVDTTGDAENAVKLVIQRVRDILGAKWKREGNKDIPGDREAISIATRHALAYQVPQEDREQNNEEGKGGKKKKGKKNKKQHEDKENKVPNSTEDDTPIQSIEQAEKTKEIPVRFWGVNADLDLTDRIKTWVEEWKLKDPKGERTCLLDTLIQEKRILHPKQMHITLAHRANLQCPADQAIWDQCTHSKGMAVQSRVIGVVWDERVMACVVRMEEPSWLQHMIWHITLGTRSADVRPVEAKWLIDRAWPAGGIEGVVVCSFGDDGKEEKDHWLLQGTIRSYRY